MFLRRSTTPEGTCAALPSGRAYLARLLGAATMVILATSLVPPAGAQVQPQDYLRSYLDLTGNYPPATEHSDGAVEVRGVVQGKLRAGGTLIWLVRGAEENAAPVRFVSTQDYPDIETGTRVRALGRGALSAAASVDLIAIISEGRMAAWEQTNAPKSAPSPAESPLPSRATPFTAPRRTGPERVVPARPTPSAGAKGRTYPATPPNGSAPPRWRGPAGQEAAARAARSAEIARAGDLTSRGYEAWVPAYSHAARWFNPRLTPEQADLISRCIIGFSVRYGLDPRLVVAVIAVESDFSLTSTSSKGAAGLGQLMPGTARDMGVANPYNPVQNIEASVRLIRGHLDTFSGKPGWEQLALALASYNAGSGAVRRFGGVPPYRETQRYIIKVRDLYLKLRGDAGQ